MDAYPELHTPLITDHQLDDGDSATDVDEPVDVENVELNLSASPSPAHLPAGSPHRSHLSPDVAEPPALNLVLRELLDETPTSTPAFKAPGM